MRGGSLENPDLLACQAEVSGSQETRAPAPARPFSAMPVPLPQPQAQHLLRGAVLATALRGIEKPNTKARHSGAGGRGSGVIGGELRTRPPGLVICAGGENGNKFSRGASGYPVSPKTTPRGSLLSAPGWNAGEGEHGAAPSPSAAGQAHGPIHTGVHFLGFIITNAPGLSRCRVWGSACSTHPCFSTWIEPQRSVQATCRCETHLTEEFRS